MRGLKASGEQIGSLTRLGWMMSGIRLHDCPRTCYVLAVCVGGLFFYPTCGVNHAAQFFETNLVLDTLIGRTLCVLVGLCLAEARCRVEG